MYVRSEDGQLIAPIHPGALAIDNHNDIVLIPHGDETAYEIFCTESITRDKCLTEALARMDDVTEWLNAPEVWWKDNDGGMVTKPTVYEFGKPIGYWRQQ